MWRIQPVNETYLIQTHEEKTMPDARVQVEYKYTKPGGLTYRGSTTMLVKQQSETLVLQKLRDRHKGHEIELVKIQWK
jgi:hypothetical protein